ncbi:hypothetical protein SCLCIDRAFT_1209490 [Scleroderma citrinum Foug A]|uniref:Uncharacterized protein n=1 Tax=Scleroderma citrinum Foug A TaxID=1036808 RepID=A0A0C3AT41_9AGAM|nr:hypothetical protein SCLCIDRAFT_1209490 [Scleroderma citrinum Foug A]
MPDRFIELVALPPRVVSACCETYLKHVFLDIWCAQAIEYGSTSKWSTRQICTHTDKPHCMCQLPKSKHFWQIFVFMIKRR